MAGIRLTKAERAWITERAEAANDKVALGLLAKLEKAELPVKKGGGLAPQVAISAFREALGRRLVVPPNGAGGVYAQMGKRLSELGLTRGDCVTVAKVAAAEWEGLVRAESLVRQADKLLAASQMTIDLDQRGVPATPRELQDDEL